MKSIFIKKKKQNSVQHISNSFISCAFLFITKKLLSDSQMLKTTHLNKTENNFMTVLQGVYLKIGRDGSSENLSPFYISSKSILL